MESQSPVFDSTCCNSFDEPIQLKDIPATNENAAPSTAEATDLERQKQPKVKSAPIVLSIKPSENRKSKLFFCGLSALLLAIIMPFMLAFGTVGIKIIGAFGISLCFFFLTVTLAIVFDAIEILGTMVFNWCMLGGFLTTLLCSSVFAVLIWKEAL
ncbi:hypothetical protein KGF57_000876 [Candida theae]|uniref:Uncharacterized protein n=1 Tax=Candida theae TaxID=1198502 RepID=A0AAD5G0B6_9ASCO|nr:uncharacterized protein KGF57_000876 [Candida theae]KAI5965083.1 hypothetical protein KGF57_000876 [Candida theae]